MTSETPIPGADTGLPKDAEDIACDVMHLQLLLDAATDVADQCRSGSSAHAIKQLSGMIYVARDRAEQVVADLDAMEQRRLDARKAEKAKIGEGGAKQ